MSKDLRYDRHTVSLLSNHMAFCQKYKEKVLVVVAEGIRQTCKELFIQYPPKYCVSLIAKMFNYKSDRVLKRAFPELKNGTKVVYERQVAIMDV